MSVSTIVSAVEKFLSPGHVALGRLTAAICRRPRHARWPQAPPREETA